MQIRTRKIVQAVLYELIAIALVVPLVIFFFDQPIGTSSLLGITISLIAVSWNYVFNTIFEYWEARQIRRGRPAFRRILHAVGFEGGLTIFTVPLIAFWLDVSLGAAFIANIGLLVVFFLYAIVFHWCFDKIFGLPESARCQSLRTENSH